MSSGGLGPTDDDRTRQTVAELLGAKTFPRRRGVAVHSGAISPFGRAMPEINERQAIMIEGATVLPNPRGTAPGLWLEAAGTSSCYCRVCRRKFAR